MITRIVWLPLILVLLLAGVEGATAAPPKQLYGKSILVSWSEDRTQRPLGAANTNHVIVSNDLVIYVSTAGRTFNRFTSHAQRAGARRGVSATAERAPGEKPTTIKAGSTQFSGRSLAIISQFESGARRITVDFDSSFGSCTAQVIQAKEAGAGKMIITSVITKQQLEVLSVAVVRTRCAIKDGNVFAGQ